MTTLSLIARAGWVRATLAKSVIRILLCTVFMGGLALGQELPAAPSATVGSRSIFWSVSLAAVGSTVFDEYITNDGIYHSSGGCYEANGGDPYPSTGKMYAKNLAITGAAIGAGYLITKLPAFKGHPKLAALVGSSFPAIVMYKHIHGGARWYTFKNGACLR